MQLSRLSRQREPWLTRQIVADMLGVDISKVRRMERSGELLPVIDERGVHRFRRETVLAMAKARGRVIGGIVAPPGVAAATAGRAFEMFDRGMSWRDVVLALQQTIPVVWALRDAYFEAKSHEMQQRDEGGAGDGSTGRPPPRSLRARIEEWRRELEARDRERQVEASEQRRRQAAIERRLRELLTQFRRGRLRGHGVSAEDVARLRAWLIANSDS